MHFVVSAITFSFQICKIRKGYLFVKQYFIPTGGIFFICKVVKFMVFLFVRQRTNLSTKGFLFLHDILGSFLNAECRIFL